MLLKKLKNPQVILSIMLQLSLVLLSVSYPFLYPGKAQATLSTALVRFDRQSANAQLGGVVCERASSTTGGVSKVIIGFPSTFNLNAATWTVDTTAANLPNTTHGDAFNATPWPSISTGGPTVVDNATKAAVFTSGNVPADVNTYCFHFSTTGTNNVGTAGNDELGTVTTYTTAGAPVETFQYATSILSGTSGGQVQVTATVSASFSFSLTGGDTNGNLPLGVLNSSSLTTAPYKVTATASTNAHNGFISWVKGTNAQNGLYSATSGDTIAAVSGGPVDLRSNTGWGLYGHTTDGVTFGSNFASTDDGNSVGQVDSQVAYQFASKTGQQSGTTFQIGARAKPLSTTAAATDYSDTITVTAAGSF